MGNIFFMIGTQVMDVFFFWGGGGGGAGCGVIIKTEIYDIVPSG